ncbi:MAG: hypothetical protein J5966_00025, partial [Lachnospiraceae bacterium]|nr:hypothetical protein [Lachnospiraceae bacterium]
MPNPQQGAAQAQAQAQAQAPAQIQAAGQAQAQAPAQVQAAGPVQAQPVGQGPVQAPQAAVPVNAEARKKSMAKDISRRSAFAARWEGLYNNAASREEDFERVAGQVSMGIVNEFHKTKHVSDKSVAGRKQSFRSKEEFRRQAAEIHEQAEGVITRQGAEQEVDSIYAGDADAFARRIKEMMDDKTLFMEFKDDKNFLKHYGASVGKLKQMQALYSILKDITPEDYARFGERLEAQDLGELPSLEKARQKALDCVYILDYYEAKMDVLRNPYYTILKESDTEALTKEDKKKLAEGYAAKNHTKLSEYFNALYRMDEASSLGANHTEDSRMAAFRFGNSGRTGKKWRLDFFSLTHGATRIKKSDLSSVNFGYKALEKEQKAEGDKEDPKLETSDAVSAGIGLNVATYSAKLKAAKASVKKKWKLFSFGANASALALNTESLLAVNAGGSYSKSKGFKAAADQGVSASVNVGGAAVQGRIKAGLDLGVASIGIKAKGKALTASASANAKAGYITWKDKNGEEHKEFAAAGILEAGAALAEAEGGITFTLFGVKIGASLTGQFGGAGGVIGGAVTRSSVEASFGALFGLGFKLSIKLDFYGVINYYKKRKAKKKLKEEQRSKYESKRRGRGLPPGAAHGAGAAGGAGPGAGMAQGHGAGGAGQGQGAGGG